MSEEDIRIDTFTNAAPFTIMRIVHIPSGLHVQGEGISSYKLKRKLMNELKELIGGSHE